MRFSARPLQIGKPALGTFDREGKSYRYFSAAKDQNLIPELQGTAANSWKMLDPKGREMPDWFGAVVVGEAGEHNLVLTGPPEIRYDLVLREARHRDLVDRPKPRRAKSTRTRWMCGVSRENQGTSESWKWKNKESLLPD